MNNKEIVLKVLRNTFAPLSLFEIERRAENYGATIPQSSVRRIVNELDHDLSLDLITTYIRGIKFVSIESGYPKTWGANNGNYKLPSGVSRGDGELLVHGVPYAAADGSAWGLR